MDAREVTTSQKQAMERPIRIAGILVVLGLIIEAASLAWAHPTAFIVFVGVGGTFMAAGILLFLYSVVSHPT